MNIILDSFKTMIILDIINNHHFKIPESVLLRQLEFMEIENPFEYLSTISEMNLIYFDRFYFVLTNKGRETLYILQSNIRSSYPEIKSPSVPQTI